jgi:predicted enzyme related to lactoylglutathione lyase
MTARMGALVLSTTRVEQTLAFYRAVGFPLSEEDHGDGVEHWACDAHGVHLAVFRAESDGDAPGYHHAGSTFCGFVVDDVDAVMAQLCALGSPIVQEPNAMPWGVRAVVSDPDGRPVEIFTPQPEDRNNRTASG